MFYLLQDGCTCRRLDDGARSMNGLRAEQVALAQFLKLGAHSLGVLLLRTLLFRVNATVDEILHGFVYNVMQGLYHQQ